MIRTPTRVAVVSSVHHRRLLHRPLEGARVVLVTGSYGAGHDSAARETALLHARAGARTEVHDIVHLLPLRLGRLLRSAYRPPNGVRATESFLTARRTGLHTALWATWGRDRERRATPASITRAVRRQPRAGGKVILHDTDRNASPGSWSRTLVASEALVEGWRGTGDEVGPLAEHVALPTDCG